MKHNQVSGTTRAAVAATVASLAMLLFGGANASASAPVAAAAPSSATAVIRGAHFSPDTPGVDVYLTSFSGRSTTLWLSDIGYGDVSAYRQVKPGLYIVAMRKHGAPASSPAGLKWTLKAAAGKAYTAAAVGMNSKLKGIVLSDRLASPTRGHGLVRVIQAASRAPRATLVAGPDTVVASNAAFASSTGYASVPAGQWTVRAKAVPESVSATKTVTVRAGSVNSLVVLDSQGEGIELRAIEDASGSALSPRGPVDAGGGAMASQVSGGPDGLTLWSVILGSAISLGACSLLIARRRNASLLG